MTVEQQLAVSPSAVETLSSFTGLFVSGQWRESVGPQQSVDVVNPATEDVVRSIPSANPEDCANIVGAAADAQILWSELAPRARAQILTRAWELMLEEADHFAELIVLENGKSWADAASEVAYAAEFFRWFSEEAVRVRGDMRRSPSGGNWIMVTHEPIGVALLVTPWNYPAAMATRKIAPALAAGCSVILKPAAETPLTAMALVDLLQRAGVPDGVVNLAVTKRSGPFVEKILADTRVRALSFTGSTEVGRILLQQAAENVVKCSMELGGNAPFLVMADADVDAAVEGFMVAKMRNGGSACTAANRVYVHRSVIEPFVDGIVRKMSAMQVGPGIDRGNQLGALVNERTRKTIEDLVAGAVAEGGVVATGGKAFGPGYFYEPTVIVDVPADAEISKHEIFGPVAAITVFDDPAEAVRLANDSQAGLIAYAYTRDLNSGLRISRSLQAGMVGLNRGMVSDPAAPFGGMKQSGLGREGASEGIHEFLETKYISTDY